MRVLVLHSRYASGDTSGENRVVRDEVAALRAAGHDVTTWEPSPQVTSPVGLARAGLDAVWSSRAASRVRTLIRRRGCELVHVHNLFPSLSPTVFRAARDEGVALVTTLHNYRFLCLPATLMRDGHPCSDCVGRAAWPGVVHRCYRGSAMGSATIATALGVHRAAGSFDAVDRFAAVSRYIKDTYTDAGFGRGRIVVKPNFSPPTARRRGVGDGFLYLGRLAPEKGVDILLDAWRTSGAAALGALTVAGSGPEASSLRAAAPAGVRFLGDVPADEAAALVRTVRAVLIPSRWEEAAVPRVALEAYASGVPVVASTRGALPEGVEDGQTGRLVPTDEPEAWRDAIASLIDDATCRQLGDGAFDRWRRSYAPDVGVAALERLYEEATTRS